MKRSLIRSFAVAGSLVSSGCAVVDQFGDRAVDYNIQGERARNQFLLLNIIRSAYHKPMQFSVLTTVTGTATASGGLSSVLPLGGPASGYQINPSSNLLSGGPTFTVANQVDKEFYQGILTPVPIQTIDWLFQAGYPKQLLLTLFVSKISFRRANDKKGAQGEFLNHPNNSLLDFQEVTNELINEGITTESRDFTDEIGPPLTSAQAAQMDGISRLKAQGLDLDKTKSGNSTKASTYRFRSRRLDIGFVSTQCTKEVTRFCMQICSTASASLRLTLTHARRRGTKWKSHLVTRRQNSLSVDHALRPEMPSTLTNLPSRSAAPWASFITLGRFPGAT